MNTHTRSRFLAWLLLVAMVLTMLPTAAFAAEAAVLFDSKAVGLILDTGDQLEAFGTLVDGNLHIVVV